MGISVKEEFYGAFPALGGQPTAQFPSKSLAAETCILPTEQNCHLSKREQKQADHLFDHALRSKACEHLATDTRDNVVKNQAVNKYFAGEELQSCAHGQRPRSCG